MVTSDHLSCLQYRQVYKGTPPPPANINLTVNFHCPFIVQMVLYLMRSVSDCANLIVDKLLL